MFGFRARMLEEFPPRRGGEEQVAHFNPRAGGARSGGYIALQPAFHADAMRGAITRAGSDGKPRHGADGRQSLTPKAERRDTKQGRFFRQFGGGVAFHGQRQILRPHADAVIFHQDAVHAPAFDCDSDAPRPGIQGVFDNFLERGRRAFHHLTSRDAVGGGFRQQADGRARRGKGGCGHAPL